jgi:hypothetical protein
LLFHFNGSAYEHHSKNNSVCREEKLTFLCDTKPSN